MHQEEQESIKICKILKLSNGETIIGNITKETVSYIDINAPLKVLLFVRPDENSMSLSVIKWDPTFNYTMPVRIYKNSIVACAEPTELMLKNYDEILEQSSKRLEKEDEPVEQGDEITELNDAMTELLRRIKPDTLH
jgi:hypothetical protein